MSFRTKRVSEIILRELGTIIHRELTFPVPLVTISAVDITPDLKNAHIFVSAIGDANHRGSILEILEKNRPMLQSELSKRVVIKYTPHLHFRFDEGLERGTRVLNILDELDIPNDDEDSDEQQQPQ